MKNRANPVLGICWQVYKGVTGDEGADFSVEEQKKVLLRRLVRSRTSQCETRCRSLHRSLAYNSSSAKCEDNFEVFELFLFAVLVFTRLITYNTSTTVT